MQFSCLNPQFQNQCLLFLLPPLFQRTSESPRQDPIPSRLTSRIYPLSFSNYKLRRVLSLSRVFVEFSFKPVYPILNFDVQIAGKCIVSQKIESRHFYLCPSSGKTLPQVLIILSQDLAKFLIPPSRFFVENLFPSTKRGRKLLYVHFLWNQLIVQSQSLIDHIE